ncbi:MAG: helix-turn-helix transcriptional regulator, partial [Trueperaceae bacterium]
MRHAGPAAEVIPLAKLRTPELRPQHVARAALTERLAGAWRHPVTLVCAPAGFGKTSAVVAALGAPVGRREGDAAAHEPGGRLAWVSLDEHDAEPQRFFRLLGAALQRATGLGSELVATLASPQPPPVRPLLPPLLNALAEADANVLLCIDDLHVVEDARVHDDLAFLVEHAPRGLRLLLASRADPPLPLHRWRARGQLLEVRADDLRLSIEETSTLLDAVLGRTLDAATAAAVQRATEGWAVGVRLASLALRGTDEGDARDERALVAGLEAGEGFALEFLAEEVLAHLPAELAAFVLDASVLDAFTPDLVDAVRTATDAHAHLDR